MFVPSFQNIDAAVAQEIKRPKACVTKYSPSKGNVFGQFNKPTADISKFSKTNPLVTKFRTKLIDIMYEAQSQEYILPNVDCLNAAIISFNIISKHRLGIHSYTPISEGGIALDMYFGSKYIHIQYDNEGDAALYVEDPNANPKGWDLTFSESFAKLEELLA